MNRRFTSVTWVALGAVLALHSAFAAWAAEAEGNGVPEAAQAVQVDFEAADICNWASWYPIAVHPRLGPTGCVSHLDSGGFVWLYLPDDLLREAHLRMDFLVPSAPLPGVPPYGLLQLNHLLVAYLFEQQGIAVAVIADNGEVAPSPSFIDGEILGEIAYGVPFEVTVHTKMDLHRLTVRQGGEVIASAVADKADPHSDPLTFVSYFNARGAIQGLDWFFGSAEFKGVKSGEGYGAFPFGPVLGGLVAERIGDVIRVSNLY